MAPTGTKSKGKARDARSRNTTPLSTGSVDFPLANATYDDLLESYCRASSPPSSSTLKKIADTLRSLSDVAKENSSKHDKGMREMSRKRKLAVEQNREREIAEREAEEERREKHKRLKVKKDRDDERPLAVGAHAVANQDGTERTEDEKAADAQNVNEEAEKKQEAAMSRSTSISSISSHQPRPAPAIPQFQTFGPDPSTFDDPTIYHIREVDDYMSEEQKEEILGVAYYPHDDLHDLTCGTPPDRDFSNNKPPNQVSSNQFQNYLEPYVKPLTEEEIAFLKERGDRVGPFMIPRRGTRAYREIWAEEDGNSFGTSSQNDRSLNQPLGSIEQMNDETAETNDVSTGPMLARLLATLRPERRVPPSEPTAQTNGETNNSMEMDVDGPKEEQSRPLQPATAFAEATQPGWKTTGPKLDYAQMEERIKAELRNIGFLSEDADTDYDGQNDDEVAARLRYLQDELQHVSTLNGARKARVLELVEERMAQQEYSTIADDLDNQLNQAYQKRHRNIGKGKNKLKRPGGAGGGSHPVAGVTGVSKPGVGEPLRSLMERRSQWNNVIGPVVDHGKTVIPKQSIFDEGNMKRLLGREKESWSEAQEQN